MFIKKYSTALVAETLGLDIQMIMWSMIEKWKSERVKLDYLQVYELSIETACGEVYQKIEHSQEIEAKTETFYYKSTEKPVNAKIYIIDDGEQATMMYNHEY